MRLAGVLSRGTRYHEIWGIYHLNVLMLVHKRPLNDKKLTKYIIHLTLEIFPTE